MASTVAALIAAEFALYLVIRIWMSTRRARNYSRLVHTERTRSVWAKAREELFNLVRDEKLDPRSETFRTLFQLQTFILRRPDDYEAIADQLQKALLGPMPKNDPPWLQEQSQWPPEMKRVLGRMANGSMMLAFGYPGFWSKLFVRLWQRMPDMLAGLAKAYLRFLVNFAKGSTSVRVERDLVETSHKLSALAGKPAPNRLSFRTV